MTATVNYAGRDLDLLIFQGFNPQRETQVDMSLDKDGEGYVCAGVQKIAQEFTILFLTEKGSNPWDPERGTEFMTNLRYGLIQDESELQSQFNFALLDIQNYLQGKVLADTPNDEILADIELLSFNLTPGNLVLYVRLTSAAGDSRDFVIPVKVVNG